jgi:hypothetical protein
MEIAIPPPMNNSAPPGAGTSATELGPTPTYAATPTLAPEQETAETLVASPPEKAEKKAKPAPDAHT